MTKDKFIKRIKLIQNFHSEQETLGALINKVTDGFCVVDFGDTLVTEIINMINEDLKIEDKYLIDWWLYEDVDKIIYEGDDCEVGTNVETVEQLYDYIVRSYNK